MDDEEAFQTALDAFVRNAPAVVPLVEDFFARPGNRGPTFAIILATALGVTLGAAALLLEWLVLPEGRQFLESREHLDRRQTREIASRNAAESLRRLRDRALRKYVVE